MITHRHKMVLDTVKHFEYDAIDHIHCKNNSSKDCSSCQNN